MAKLKVGVIGAGGISGCHIVGYQQLENTELTAICDINEERAKLKAQQYGFKHVYTDYNKMLKEHKLDCVSVCTWNNVHADASIAALKSGANVLCEKPMAMNSEEAEEMLKASIESEKLLMIGFVRRFENKVMAMKKIIDQGTLGEIYYGKTSYTRRRGRPGGWFSDKRRSGGGSLIDVGVHNIDLVRYLMGKPYAVSAVGNTFNRLSELNPETAEGQYKSSDFFDNSVSDVEDSAVGLVTFENGAVIFLETSWVQNIREADKLNLELYGTKAGVYMEPGIELAGEMNGFLINSVPVLHTSEERMFEREIEHFVECVGKGIPCINTAEDGLEVMKILDAIYKSAQIGETVHIAHA